MSAIWTKIAVYGDGTIKLPPELLEQLGLVPGEGGAIYVAKGEVTKDRVPTGKSSLMAVGVKALMDVAPEELEPGTPT